MPPSEAPARAHVRDVDSINTTTTTTPIVVSQRSGASSGPRHYTFRELYYSHVGGFDQRWIEGSTEHWLDRLRNNVALGNADAETRPADLVDRNTFVSVSWGQTRKVAEVILAAVAEGGRGTRATMEVDPRQAGGLGRMGFRREHADASPRGTVFMSLGSRGCTLQLRWLARPAACISSGGTTTQRVQAI